MYSVLFIWTKCLLRHVGYLRLHDTYVTALYYTTSQGTLCVSSLTFKQIPISVWKHCTSRPCPWVECTHTESKQNSPGYNLIGKLSFNMMTSANGNIFRVTGHLCGKFTGRRWIPRTKASDEEVLMFSLICAGIDGWVNNRKAGDLRHHRTHYNVIIITLWSLNKMPDAL